MPIYMDRHDVSESVTAENVAQLHSEDLKIQDDFNCRGLTYWFDDIKKIAFCLIDAPNIESIRKMHNHAHGEVPNHIIEVDPNLVESFLGRIKDPVNSTQKELNIISDPAQRTLMIISFGVVSFADSGQVHSNKDKLHVTNAIRDFLNRFDGKLVKQINSQLLISFISSHNAILCALEVKQFIEGFNKGVGQSTFKLKMGLDTGMPINNSKSFFEDTIKLASFLCFIKKSTIVVSAEIKNGLSLGKREGSFEIDELHSLPITDERFLMELGDFIENEWRNIGLKVEDFGVSLGMSKTLVYKKMISLTGQSPNSFVREYRLNRALEQIELNVKTISEIAFESGFNSTSYFSRCFQKRFGLLPSVYLKRLKVIS